MSKNTEGGFLSVGSSEQYRAISNLIDESRGDNTYYMLLILSTIIISSGVLLANSAILIGGMLVTPVLTPILAISLGISTGKIVLIKRSFILIIKSTLIIFAISVLAGVIFSVPENTDFYKSSLFDNSLRSAFLYFIVALSSGVAATFTWVRKGVNDILPGISIAVSLVPPLSMVAIWFASFEFELMRFFLMVFLFNLFGIIMGGLIVFSMLNFYRSGQVIVKKVNEEIEEEENNELNQEIFQSDTVDPNIVSNS